MFKQIFKVASISIASLLISANVSAKPINWKFYGVLPPSHEYSKMMMQAFDNVSKKTDGELNIKFHYFDETPYGVGDALRIIRDGLVEMVEWTPAYTAGTFPLMAAPELPFLLPKLMDAAEAQTATDKAWKAPMIVERFDQLMSDYRTMQVSKYYFEPMNFWFTSEVSDLDEIKGKKIRVFMPVQGQLVSSIGGSPVTVPTTEQYTALQRNVINGTITGSGNLEGAKLAEVLKSGYITNLMMTSSRLLISKRKLESLPKDMQEILLNEMQELQDRFAEVMPKRDKSNLDFGTEHGMTFTKASPEDYLIMRKTAIDEVWPEWAKEVGSDGEKAIAEVLATQESN